jgi:hypothetical protein
MKNKKTGVFIVLMLMVAVIPLATGEPRQMDGTTDEGYILDQMQTDDGFYSPVTMDNPVAQSFKPALTPLAKVRLLVRLEGQIIQGPSQQIQVSIRKYVDGADLTTVTIPASDLTTEQTWVNFDFDDITVTPEDTYYIILSAILTQGEIRWFSMQNMDMDLYERGEAWYLDTSQTVVKWVMYPDYTDFCFKTYSYAGKISDLDCHTVFGWPDQQAGGRVSDEIIIRNIGDSHSLLNWEIASYPEWGNWTFDPALGFDLEPEDGELSIGVTVDVPNEQDMDFTGEITIVNSEDENDVAVVPVSMSTEKHKFFSWISHLPWFLQYILEKLCWW